MIKIILVILTGLTAMLAMITAILTGSMFVSVIALGMMLIFFASTFIQID
jgi:hypothetical protein